MTSIWQTLSFLVFGVFFVGAAGASSVFILPLLFLSFLFSGFVVVFSGLSYATFKLASSKYNHTVLFLNYSLRKLADTIPPSVGFQEVKPSSKQALVNFLPLFDFKDSYLLIYTRDKIELIEDKITGLIEKVRKLRSTHVKKSASTNLPVPVPVSVPLGPDAFEVEQQTARPPLVVYDYEDNSESTVNDVLDLNELEPEEIPELNGNTVELQNAGGDDQAIKDSELNN